MEELDRMMSERGDDLRHLKDKMNRVEDEVFADFCTMIGVPNIRWVALPVKGERVAHRQYMGLAHTTGGVQRKNWGIQVAQLFQPVKMLRYFSAGKSWKVFFSQANIAMEQTWNDFR